MGELENSSEERRRIFPVDAAWASTHFTHTGMTCSSMTMSWIQHTLTTRTSSVGLRTGKQKASFHWGEVVRSHTFRAETNLFSYQDLCNYDDKKSIFKLARYLTVVLWESFPRVTSAPTFGSLPLFFSFQHKSRSELMRICGRHKLVLSLRSWWRLTGRPFACSTKTNSKPAEGTALFWKDCLE